MDFSERAWKFPFARACAALLLVGVCVAHTYFLFGLSVDLVFVGFLFVGVWALVIAYSVLAFPKMWKTRWDFDKPKEGSAVSHETVFRHKSIVGICESRRLVKFSFIVYMVFVVTRSIFVDKINETVFFIGLLFVLYAINAVSEYWSADEKTMWLKFVEDEYERGEYK